MLSKKIVGMNVSNMSLDHNIRSLISFAVVVVVVVVSIFLHFNRRNHLLKD